MQDTYLGVMPRLTRGLNNVNTDADVPRVKVVDFETAMKADFAHDAHFVCYNPVGEPQNIRDENGDLELMRCNKSALPSLRAHGVDLHTVVFGVDYDNPNHGKWTPALRKQFFETLQEMAEADSIFWEWNALYLTEHGARFVYILKDSMPVEEAEPLHRGLVSLFHQHGLMVDAGCSDWTRLFRLPGVRRGDEDTRYADYFFLELQPDFRLDASTLPSVGRVVIDHTDVVVPEFDEPKPEPEEVQDILYNTDGRGRKTMTAFHKYAKKRLKNRECFDCIFDDQPIARQGRRNDTIHKYVGQACGLLVWSETMDILPEHIYALFHGSVEQLEPDEQTPDWTDVLWSSVGRLWSSEKAKRDDKEKQEEAKAEEAIEVSDQIIQGMAEWNDAKELRLTDGGDAWRFASRHLIAHSGQTMHIMTPRGYYDEMGVGAAQLIPRIRQLGMDSLIECATHSDNGIIWRKTQDILNDHATPISTIEARPCIDHPYIEHPGKFNASLILPAFRRNPHLIPAYDADVDAWLKETFCDHYELVNRWVGHALAFEEGPIAALSLEGPQGFGKKMFTEGLAECLEVPMVAQATDITGTYQYGLLNSPFIVVNEGWPSSATGHGPADRFRALVSGDPIEINRRWMHPVRTSIPYRILFTANNTEVVRMLSGNRDLSPEDREALAIRLLHLRLDSRGADHLRRKGGLAHTGRTGRRWIRPDGGGKSDYVIAKHFLWLYANRPSAADASRFLVEGNLADELVMFELRTQSGAAPFVIEAIIKMLEKSQVNRPGMVVTADHRLYITTAEILEYYRMHLSGSAMKERLTANTIGKVMRGLVLQDKQHPFVIPERKAEGRKRWMEVDCELLLDVARRDGWKCHKLHELVMQQRAASKAGKTFASVKPIIDKAYEQEKQDAGTKRFALG